jgi:GNAT superfamily N-acetyltransferase
MDPSSLPLLATSRPPLRISGEDEVKGLVFGDLSDFFNPFLGRFVRDALHGGGEVWVSKENGTVIGLLLFNGMEKLGSIFTRDPAAAETLYRLKEGAALFTEFPPSAKAEVYHVMSTDPAAETKPHHFIHVVRMARPAEEPAIARMLNEMYGQLDTSWLQAVSREGDRCFLVEVAGEIAGVGWVSVVGPHGRLHSLSVRPHYRRMRIGTDLWHARLLWARRAGARRVLSEISEHNAASLAIATAGGMHRVGRMFLSQRPAPVSADGRPAVRTDLVRHVD